MRRLLSTALCMLALTATAQQGPHQPLDIRYHFGDDPNGKLGWANPDFDDSAWPIQTDGNFPLTPAHSDGFVWVRIHMQDVGEMVKQLNQKLGGWANYFKLGPVTPVYRFIDRYTKTRLRRWLCKKHRWRDRGITHYPDEHFYNQLGLIRLSKLPQNFPWAKA